MSDSVCRSHEFHSPSIPNDSHATFPIFEYLTARNGWKRNMVNFLNSNHITDEWIFLTVILKLRSIFVDPSSDTLRISVRNSLWVRNRSAAGSDFGTAEKENAKL